MAEPLFRYDDEPDTMQQYVLRRCKAGLIEAENAAAVLEMKDLHRAIVDLERHVEQMCERVRSRG